MYLQLSEKEKDILSAMLQPFEDLPGINHGRFVQLREAWTNHITGRELGAICDALPDAIDRLMGRMNEDLVRATAWQLAKDSGETCITPEILQDARTLVNNTFGNDD